MSLPLPDRTIAALATPQGVGAIGVIRLSGKDAFPIAAKVFRGKDLLSQASHTIHLGMIMDNEQPVDEVLVSLFKGPKSYTGEDVVEISTHGSPFIQKKILEILARQGAHPAGPGEFTFRAFLNKKLDLAQAEAVADMIASDSEEALQTAISQIRGHFSERIKALREELLGFVSMIELELDFAEEDVEFADRSQLKKLVQDIISEMNALLESFRFGNVVRNGIPTVIAGKPNAGKSTLLNTLLNEERAIVSDIPGTTRDTIEEAIQIKGVLFRFVDTAGIRAGESEIEKIGIDRTFEKIRNAGLILYLFDAGDTSASDLEKEIAELKVTDSQQLLLVANKSDKANEADLREKFHAWPGIVYISAKEKRIETLLQKLEAIVQESKVAGSGVMVTNSRHYAALLSTRNYLGQVLVGIDDKTSGELLSFNIRKAMDSLAAITGEITTDDILGNIFSRFCIGK